MLQESCTIQVVIPTPIVPGDFFAPDTKSGRPLSNNQCSARPGPDAPDSNAHSGEQPRHMRPSALLLAVKRSDEKVDARADNKMVHLPVGPEAIAMRAAGHFESSTLGWSARPSQVAVALPEGLREALDMTLDAMRASGELFCGAYVVLGLGARRNGGHGLVQFMDRSSDGLGVAVKFFLDQVWHCLAVIY
jgi:hypothetical protein